MTKDATHSVESINVLDARCHARLAVGNGLHRHRSRAGLYRSAVVGMADVSPLRQSHLAPPPAPSGCRDAMAAPAKVTPAQALWQHRDHQRVELGSGLCSSQMHVGT